MGLRNFLVKCVDKLPCGPWLHKIFFKRYLLRSLFVRKVYWEQTHNCYSLDFPTSTTSMLCNNSFFDMPFFQYWSELLHDNFCNLMRASGQLSEKALASKVVYHRKLWEFVYILQSLYERGCLVPGKKGLGFGVGTEALPAIMASRGVEVVATDLDVNDARSAGWCSSSENTMNDKNRLNQFGICPPDIFEKLVSFQCVDMTKIPESLSGFDFCWSSCALEHLGSIEQGLVFIENSMKTLKKGGFAVHTTEYNLSSNTETLDHEKSVLYRKKDILGLKERLEKLGYYVSPIDFNPGKSIIDNYVDTPPYSKNDMHLKLKIKGFSTTSIGLIIQKTARLE